MAEMNRDALLLYLRDVRDLEIAKRTISNIYNQDDWNYRQHYNELTIPKKQELPHRRDGDDHGMLVSVLMIFLGAMPGLKLGYSAVKEYKSFWWLFFVVVFFGGIAVIGLLGVLNAVTELKELAKQENAILQYNESEQNRVKSMSNVQEANKLQNEWKQRLDYLTTEYQKVDGILNSYYSQNILPSQFRNLAAVYYLHDYMSTSQETLRDALLQRTLTDGIQRILDKLDAVISSIQAVATQTRILEAQNQTLINNNQRMIRSLQNVEENTAVVASYAGLASNYAKANAYFSLATYLKN